MPVSDRATARHRAPQPASTPLSVLTGSLSVVGDQMGTTLGRGGAVLAVSTGLVASLGMPAQAVTRATDDDITSSVPVVADDTSSEVVLADGTLMALPSDVAAADASVAASSTATVSFDHTAFTPEVVEEPEETVTEAAAVSASSGSSASTGTSSGSSSSVAASSSGSSIVSLALRYEGVPYVYGGSSPSGFDCSGLVQYVFDLAGTSLPRIAQDQLEASTRISASQAQPGDLVFFIGSDGTAYHVGIYAGNGTMVDAPRTGKTVGVHDIWSSDVVYARA